MSGLITWVQKQLIKIQTQKYQLVTDKSSFRLINAIENYQGTYDGYAHSFDVRVMEDCSLEYSSDEKTWSSQKPKSINSGKQVFFIRAKRNNRIEQTEAFIEIYKRKIQLVSASYDKEYDGIPARAETVVCGGDGFADNTNISYAFEEGQLLVGKCNNKFSYTFEHNEEKANYEISVSYGELEVHSRVKKISLSIDAPSAEYMYDGELKSYKKNLFISVEYNNVEFHVTGVESVFSGRNAGIYSTTIKGSPIVLDPEGNNVTSEFDVYVNPGSIIIQKQKVTLRSANAEKLYDGVELEARDVIIEGNISKKDTVNATATGKIKRPGNAVNSIVYTIEDGNSGKNYDIDLQEGTLSIHRTRKPLEAQIVIPGYVQTYNGKIQDFGFVVDRDVIVKGKSYHVTGVTGGVSACDAGEYDYRISGIPKVIDEDGYDVSDLVFVSVIAERCVIEPRIVVLKSKSITAEYSGDVISSAEVTVSGDGFIDGDIVSYKSVGALCLPGKTKNGINVQFASETKSNDYRLIMQEGTICIKDRSEKYTVVINLEDEKRVYDGYEIISDKQFTKEIFIGKLKYTVSVLSIKAKGHNVGEYDFHIMDAPTVMDEQNNDVTKQFNVLIGEGKLVISPRKLKVTSGSAIKEYDGKPLSNDTIRIFGDGMAAPDKVTFRTLGTQLLPGKTLNVIEYDFNNPEKEVNYIIDVIPGELQVLHRRKKIDAMIKVDDAEALYDGEEHRIDGYVNRIIYALQNVYTVEGVKYQASLSHSGNVETVFTGNPKVFDQYKNDVSEEFNITLEPGTLLVKPRKVTIISASREREYNGRVLKDEHIVIGGDGFLEGEAPSFNVLGKQTLPGMSWNLFEYSFHEEVHSEDYEIQQSYGILEVRNRAKKYSIDVALKNEMFIYDGKVHAVKGTERRLINVDGVTYRIQEKGPSVIGIAAGVYDYDCVDNITVHDIDDNDVSDQFDIHLIPGHLSIIRRSILIMSPSESKEYDGKALKNTHFELMGDGLVNDDDIMIEVVGKQVLPGISENSIFFSVKKGEETNYDVTTHAGMLEITRRVAPFEVLLRGQSLVTLYDGTVHILPEFSNLKFEIDGVRFYIKGVSNVVTGTEEGVYVPPTSEEPVVYDEHDNDVSDQFNIVVEKGTLTIEHNSAYDVVDDGPDSYDIAIQDIIDQVAGNQPRSSRSEIKRYSRKQLETMYVDTIELLTGKGEIKPEYAGLLQSLEGNSEFVRVHNRIVEQFKDATLLSEIEIDDVDFEVLKDYFRQKYIMVRRNTKQSFVDILFSVMMVQIGIRYYDTSYWPQVASVMGVKEIAQGNRSWVGGTVTETLLAFGKPVYSENEYVSNILMHSFVTDPFSKRFFDFIYLYYSKDLGRDISGLQEADIEYVCDSIVNPYAKRKQLLSNYISMSVRGGKEYCKAIIKNTLEMIDCSFWDEPYGENVLRGRLRERFEEWKEVSEFYQPEKNKYQSNGKRNRHFRTPYFYWNMERDFFELVMPSQMIHVKDEQDLPEIRWYIIADDKQEYSCGLIEDDFGYRTKELRVKLDINVLFKRYVFLLFLGKTWIRAFNIDDHSVVFFDERGRWLSGENLDEGVTYAIGTGESELTSEALLYTSKIKGLKLYELALHRGDFVCVKGEENFYVGPVPAIGLSERAVVANVVVRKEEKEIPVYKDFPSIIIDVTDAQYNGVAIIVNGFVNRLSKAFYTDVRFGKTTGNKFYFVDLGSLSGTQKGYNRISVDYPGTIKKLTVEYYYSPNLCFEFPGSPYFYEETGKIRINRPFENNAMDLCQEADNTEIVFRFNSTKNGQLTIGTKDGAALLLTIPALFYSWDRNSWEYQKAEDIWHTDFNSIIYIKYPDEEIELCVNGANEILSTQKYRKRTDQIFECDMTKMKSYFSKGKIFETIQFISLAGKIPLLRIIQKSILHTAFLRVNVEKLTIIAKLDILGKGNYFADLFCEEKLVAEKTPVINNQATFSVDIQTANYTIKVYESEDDFGFDEEYEYIGEKTCSIINPKDMVGACMKVKGICKGNTKLIPGKEYQYYLFLNDQVSDYSYLGLMVGVFHREIMYASKVSIKDFDPNNIEQVKVSRLTYDNKLEEFLYRTDKKAIIDVHNKGREKQYEIALHPYQEEWVVEFVSSKKEIKKAGKIWLEEVEKSRRQGFSIWKR